MRRLPLGRAVLGAAILAAALAGGLSALSAQAAHATTTTVKVTKKVRAPGLYTVMVSLAPPAAAENVNVYVAGQEQSDVPIGPGAGQELAYFVTLHKRRFVVRAVGAGPKVHFTVAAALESATASPPSDQYNNLVFDDEFTGAVNSVPNQADWSYDADGNCGAGTLSQDTSNTANAALNGQGQLAITALASPSASSGTAYSAAQIDSNGHYSFTYGRIEARLEFPAGSGLCSAFWLLAEGANGAPCTSPCGEIDVVELNSMFSGVGFADLHGPMTGSPNFQQYQNHVLAVNALAGSYHTWGVIWGPNQITWTLDGLPYASATPSSLAPTAQWVFNNTPFRIIFDLAVGGWPGAPTSASGFPATMNVDWVRVYQ
jgi:beta-glucanase (GH16 family)